MKIIQKRRGFFLFSAVLIIASLVSLFTWGLKPGIDFTGGVLLELDFKDKVPSSEDLGKDLEEFDLSSLIVQPSGDKGMLLRFSSDDDEVNEKVQQRIKEKHKDNLIIKRTEFISSVISNELKEKAIMAVIFAVIGIASYIAWAFKKVSYPVKSWIYGAGAVVALVHDTLITLGAFSLLGHYYGIEVGIPFIAALLTILGYSVNDTIVIFDRIRENLNKAGAKKEFEETVNNSIRESLGRSINTSLTVIVVLLAIIFFGGVSIKYFSLALLIGIIFGTYSSVFVASALIVEVWKRR